MPEDRPKRSMLNTTIKEEVLNRFREYCKSINCPMNTVLETFMAQFANGEFSFRLNRNRMEVDTEE